jgi:hypothetical protein
MLKKIITITGRCSTPTHQGRWWLGLAFIFLLASFCQPAVAADTNSFGFIFDRFKLTLEEGCRTEAAGSFYYSQQTGDESALAFPPFFSSVANPSVEYTDYDFLYPLLTRVQYGQERRWQLFQLISFSGGQEPDDAPKNRHTVFPFYFSQRSTINTNLDYTAFFPFYGTLKNRLFRDEIHFVMFPIFSETRKRDVVTDNYLYPFGAVRHGDGMHGWQVWPLAGHERKIVMLHTNGFGDVEIVGGYHHSFYLWPLHLKQDNGIGTDNPEKFRASIPLYVYTRSPPLDSTTVLWPFFTWMDNRAKKYREWQMPWPFVIFARGEGKTTSRVFPLFSRSHNGIQESDSYLWPVYTFRRTHADPLDLRRTRVAFYLYEDTVEKNTQTGAQKRRVDMWPFFTWHRAFNGDERLQVLAPLEPAVPENPGIERNWSPLWSLWRAEANPQSGAASQSLLWNLYRRETAPAHKKVSLLFGLFQYQCDGDNKRVKLFYLTVSRTAAATQ